MGLLPEWRIRIDFGHPDRSVTHGKIMRAVPPHLGSSYFIQFTALLVGRACGHIPSQVFRLNC
jgi:hypothetical protein